MGGFVSDIIEVGTLGLVDDPLGIDASEAAARQAAGQQVEAGQAALDEQRRQFDAAMAAQQLAAEQAQGYFSPYSDIGQQALGQTGILTDPQAQMQYLKSNPLFQMSLDNANLQTNQMAAARGRLSAGDTLQQLSKNVMLSAQPLLAQQQQNVAGLLNFGSGIASNQANAALGLGTNQANLMTGFGQQAGNLLTDIGAARAAGTVGAANAETAATQGLLNLGGTLGGAWLGTF